MYINEELKSGICNNCEIIQAYKDNIATIEECRKKCSKCKKLYKFDVAFAFNETPITKTERGGNKGKKETYSKRYGKAVHNLREEGKSIRSIANILNISINSVKKLIKK